MKLNFLFFFLLVFADSILAQNFYDRTSVQKIELFFGFTNWDSQLDAATLTDTYIIADSVRINGVVFDSVGVKYKGYSSYNANSNKNPMHLSLDYVKGSQDYQGYTEVKLQNGYQDPSMIREVLSYAILEQYMDCPKANFANVYINGTLRGVYSNTESVNSKFNGEHYYASHDTYFKCNPISGVAPNETINPDLRFINMDSSSYFNGYELKSDYGWNRLLDLINTLNNDFSEIETKIDIDRAIWMIAYNNVLVNLDSYNGAFRQNYYLSWDFNDRFVPTIWDLNMSFGGFPGGTGSGTYNPISLDPFSNSASSNHPLIKMILANPQYKRMYMAHLRTIVKETFESAWYLTQANTMRSTIDSYVQADPFKFYAYDQFLNSLSSAVSSGVNSIPGIQALMDARSNFFNSNTNYMLAAPNISAYGCTTTSPANGATVYITATCSGETGVYLGYRTDHRYKFNRVQMFDDGMHGDGNANDHVFGFQVTLSGIVFEYYIYSENANAGIFSPQRAEHEYHSLEMVIPAPSVGDVLVNEIIAKNGASAFDSNNENDDWIELYNTTFSGLNLSGLYLTDNPANLAKWYFPAGTCIPANGHLAVWCDNDPEQAGLHTNFKLSATTGDMIILSNGVAIYDQITFGPQTEDISFARCPDGADLFSYVQPTFEASNSCGPATLDELEKNMVLIYPNPTKANVTIQMENSELVQLIIYDLQGRELIRTNFSSMTTIITNEWETGCYMVKITNDNGLLLTKKLVKH